jgi:hypothetical protein
MRKTTALACAAVSFALAAGWACADTCETFPGSQVYTDQCGPDAQPTRPAQNDGARSDASPSGTTDAGDGQQQPHRHARKAQPAPSDGDSPAWPSGIQNLFGSIRDRLHQILAPGGNAPEPSGSAASGSSTEDLRDRLNRQLSRQQSAPAWKPSSDIVDAQRHVTDALSNPGAPDARANYDAAMQNLRKAYQSELTKAPEAQQSQIESAIRRMEKSNGELARQVNLGGFGPPDAPATPTAGPVAPQAPAASANATQPRGSTVTPAANAQAPGTAQPSADAQTPGTAQPSADAQAPGTAQPSADAQAPGTAQPSANAQTPGTAQPSADAQTPADAAAQSTASAEAASGATAAATPDAQPSVDGNAAPTTATSTAAANTASAPPIPDNMAVLNDQVYVCDGKVAGGNVSCAEMSAGGTECTSVVLMDGVVGWRDSIPEANCKNTDALLQRNAFMAAHPKAVDPREAFAMDAPGTEAALAKLTANPTDGLDRVMDKLNVPAQCRDGLKQYVASIARINGSTQFAEFAAEDYAKVNATPECAAKLAEVAKALGDHALKQPDLGKDDLDAMYAALAMPSSDKTRVAQPVQTPQAASSGGVSLPSVSLKDAANILSIGASLLNMAHTLSGGAIPSVPSVPSIPSSAAALRVPVPSATPAPAHTMNCSYSAYDNSMFCK